MKFSFKCFKLFAAGLFSAFLFSCSLNLSRNSSSLTVVLPQRVPGTRSIPETDGDQLIKFNEDGTLGSETIDTYEVTITSSKGESLKQSADAGSGAIVFPEVDVGEWSVSFNGYALKNRDDKNNWVDKILVAKNRIPIKVNVVEGQTASAVITAEFVKYVINDSPFVNGMSVIGMNITSSGYQLELADGYIVPMSELVKFEVKGTAVKVTNNGLIVPVETGSTEVCFSRLQDGKLIKEFTVNVFPVVKINIYVKGKNIGGKYPSYTKIIANNGDTLGEKLMNFPIGSIMSAEGITCDSWYYDEGYGEEAEVTDGTVDLRSKYYGIADGLNGASTAAINLYAKIVEAPSGPVEINDYASLKAAFENGGSYTIDGKVIKISETLTLNNDLTLTLKGESTIKRSSEFTDAMIKVCGGKLTVQVNDGSAKLSLNGALYNGEEKPENRVSTDKIMEIEKNGTANLEGVTFENDKAEGAYAFASAILINGTATLKNCAVQNNQIGGYCSRAPGIKIEKGANVTLENVTFSGNVCVNSSANFGLDIWIEDRDMALTLKGDINAGVEDFVSLNYKASGSPNPITVINLNESTKFSVTYGGTENGASTNEPELGLQLFNGTIKSENFTLYYSNGSGLYECPSVKLDNEGNVVAQ